jgi:hypothetical protein
MLQNCHFNSESNDKTMVFWGMCSDEAICAWIKTVEPQKQDDYGSWPKDVTGWFQRYPQVIKIP